MIKILTYITPIVLKVSTIIEILYLNTIKFLTNIIN